MGQGAEDMDMEWARAVDPRPRADLTPSPEVVKELVEAAGDFLDAIFAEYENGDRKLRITGPTANLKWLIEAEEELRAALAKMEGR